MVFSKTDYRHNMFFNFVESTGRLKHIDFYQHSSSFRSMLDDMLSENKYYSGQLVEKLGVKDMLRLNSKFSRFQEVHYV
jgi:hypothetical protein